MSEEAVRQREERLAQMIAKIKERDFRLTPQRMAVLKILAASGQHPSVDEIYREVSEKFPTTSIVRVYKTIALLKELNEVLELGFPAAATAMTATGPTLIPMPSAPSAQKIMDPEISNVDEHREEMTRKTGYRLFFHRLDFFWALSRLPGEVNLGIFLFPFQ